MPYFATASSAAFTNSGVTRAMSWRPTSAGASSVSEPVLTIVVMSGAIPMNPSAANWSATLRVQTFKPGR